MIFFWAPACSIVTVKRKPFCDFLLKLCDFLEIWNSVKLWKCAPLAWWKMESTRCCLIHLEGIEGPLTRFSRHSLSTFLRFRETWLNVDGKQTDIAAATLQKLSKEDCEKLIDNDEEDEVPFFYHRKCYSRFTDKAKLQAAQTRKEKYLATQTTGTEMVSIFELSTT